MTYYAAFRSSPKRYTSRPPAANQAARLAWDTLAEDGDTVVSMVLFKGVWRGQYADGSTATVFRDWITAALNRRVAQGRA